MPLTGGGDWIERLSSSMREHEGAREKVRASLPRYEMLGELGRGGMAAVYRAWDPELGRQVALKVLHESYGASPETRERFLREAQMASRLDHPNIVPVYDVGEWDGKGFLAMRLVEGTTLDRAPLDLRGKLAALRDAARALDHAHRQGIVHRDVKPSNLLVDREGRVYVSDFGVARRVDLPSKLTLTGMAVGTPLYMSPEQAQGKEVDARSDVYSLGAAMYEIVSGRPPFSGADALKLMAARLTEEPPPPSRRTPGLSRAIDKIVRKAMEREPAHRYATAAELADDLQRYLNGEPILARPAPFRFRARLFFLRRGWQVAALASLLALAGVGVALWIGKPPPQDPLLQPKTSVDGFVKEFLGMLKEGNLGGARIILEQIRKADPRRADKLEPPLVLEEKVKRFGDLMAAGDVDEAGELLDDIRELDPSRAAEIRPKFLLAKHCRDYEEMVREGRVEAAAVILSRIRELDAARAEQLRPLLRSREFEIGLDLLDQFSRVADAGAFGANLARLSGPDYEGQPGRARFRELVWRLALELAVRDQHAGADRWLTRAEELGETGWELYRERALARSRLGNEAGALADFRRFEGLRPARESVPREFAVLLESLGRRSLQQGAFAEAVRHLDEAMRLDPRMSQARHDRGLARFGQGSGPREALGDLKRALDLQPGLKLDPKYGTMALSVAKELWEKNWKAPEAKAREGAWTEAVQWLAPARDADPAEVRLELARMYRRLGQYPAALRELEGAGDGAPAVFARGQVRFLQRDLKGALEDFAKAESLDPQDGGRAAHWMGVCHHVLKDEKELLKALTRALERGRRSPDLSLRLAILHQGDWPAEIAHATRAIEAVGELGEDCYILRGGEGMGVAHPEVVRLFRRDASFTLATARFHGGDHKACVEDCDGCIEADPAFARAFLLRANARFRLEQYEAAIGDGDRVIAMLRDSKDPEDLKRVEDAKRLREFCLSKLKK